MSSGIYFRFWTMVMLGVSLVDTAYGTKLMPLKRPPSPTFKRNMIMPDEWKAMCKTSSDKTNKSFISIYCHVNVEDVWDFNHFRNWSVVLDNDTLVSLDIVCEDGARICLPWPYREGHLHTLRVTRCTNTCYYSDFNRPEVLDIPDSLRVFEGYDVTEERKLLDMLSIDIKSLPAPMVCGPMHLEVFIYRHKQLKILFDEDSEDYPQLEDLNITDTITKNTRNMDDLGYVCKYENMRVFDKSQRIRASSLLIYSSVVNSRFPQLRILNFSDTELQVFPPILAVWRRHFDKLQILDLSHNNISRFELRDTSLLSQDVGIIDLRFNDIRKIGEKEIESFSKVDGVVINVRDNPFQCDCAMGNFSMYLQKYSSTTEAGINRDYAYLWDLECVTPEKFRGKRISEFTRKILCSTDMTAYISQISAICVTVVIFLIFVILCVRYRKEIRILTFTRCNIILPCQSFEHSSNKTYDAFVAYSHIDSAWVVKTLLPRLESGSPDGNNFRLCLHQRDFAVGAAIADNICQSVEASRHTILVLSRKFLESEWCLMEFRTAFHQSLIEKKKHLILVLLEDIPVSELDADFRRCMQTWTYIHISDKLFWDRIVYSLTDKSKPKKKTSIAKDVPTPGNNAENIDVKICRKPPEQYDLC
ncbi:toll-like receptor 6 [Haliotis cracherodii]|uniref:toll-like receptor 6 n=1 Tax=Haliotis cracherodii TaxID=6455 RepID=UPI0039EC11BC